MLGPEADGAIHTSQVVPNSISAHPLPGKVGDTDDVQASCEIYSLELVFLKSKVPTYIYVLVNSTMLSCDGTVWWALGSPKGLVLL